MTEWYEICNFFLKKSNKWRKARFFYSSLSIQKSFKSMYYLLMSFIHVDIYYNLKKILFVHFSVTKKSSQKLNQYDIFKNKTVVCQLHSIGNVVHFFISRCFFVFAVFWVFCMGIGSSFEHYLTILKRFTIR